MAENWLDQALIVCNAIINPDHILLMDQYSDNIRNPQNEWFENSYKNQLKNVAKTNRSVIIRSYFWTVNNSDQKQEQLIDILWFK